MGQQRGRRPFTPSSGPLAGRTFASRAEFVRALRRVLAEHRRRAEAARVEEAAFRALQLMREEGLSLTLASRRAGVRRDQAYQRIASALIYRKGRYWARPTDRLTRPMRMLTAEGVQVVRTRSSRQRSEIAAHFNAVRHYLETGDDGRLYRFRGLSVDGESFETDVFEIERWASRGELDFEDIYSTLG